MGRAGNRTLAEGAVALDAAVSPGGPLPLMRGVASLCGVWGAVAGLVVSVGASARQCWSCRRRRVSWDLVVVERWEMSPGAARAWAAGGRGWERAASAISEDDGGADDAGQSDDEGEEAEDGGEGQDEEAPDQPDGQTGNAHGFPLPAHGFPLPARRRVRVFGARRLTALPTAPASSLRGLQTL